MPRTRGWNASRGSTYTPLVTVTKLRMRVMDSRQRFHAVMNYEPVDRGIYLVPWLGFPGTVERWKQEGYQEGDLARYDVDNWT